MKATVRLDRDLRPRLGPVRDQGPRPTCLAFAASDLHAAVRAGWTPLSCEAIFFRAQRRAGRPASVGTTLPALLEALRLDGQPPETDWPYRPAAPANDAAWSPPAQTGDVHRRAGEPATPDWTRLIARLDEGRPVILLITLSRSFYAPDPEGVVRPAQTESPDPALRHAVLAVAHGAVGDEPAVLVRNSWGGAWGHDGHAWLTAGFLGPRLFGMALLDEDDDVPSRSDAA
jgi:Papain family cysteine protease